jgi:hypothetical protein
LASDSVNFKVFNQVTKEELNTTICQGDFPIIIKTKIKAPELLNLTFYNTMINSSIDVYNPNASAFNDICDAHIDTNTGFDTTVNWRRTNYYQNLSAVCDGSNCTYIGIDDEDYVNCQCSGLDSTANVNSDFETYLLGQFTVWNWGVFFCARDIPVVIYSLN